MAQASATTDSDQRETSPKTSPKTSAETSPKTGKADAAPGAVPGQSGAPARRLERAVSHAALVTSAGKTHIADTVVAKISGYATREIPGVHSMGRGLSRRIGALRAMVPGQAEGMSTQGVSVEVGEKQAAIDLDIVTWYGESIVEVTEAVRRNVIERIEAMTGLEVVEVNIHVDDIHVEDGTEAAEPASSRVQ